ncbi:MAG: rRNA maturation RNase YbeY, partial [Anaerolineales bacterium]|nr:rRNA maturation RNase YbeY [Anaerolineales bacterium]
TGLVYFGDVIIAVPVAMAQASEAKHPPAAELALLTVHGVLHLLGHDHADPQERGRMESAQTAILARLGLGA